MDMKSNQRYIERKREKESTKERREGVKVKDGETIIASLLPKSNYDTCIYDLIVSQAFLVCNYVIPSRVKTPLSHEKCIQSEAQYFSYSITTVHPFFPPRINCGPQLSSKEREKERGKRQNNKTRKVFSSHF